MVTYGGGKDVAERTEDLYLLYRYTSRSSQHRVSARVGHLGIDEPHCARSSKTHARTSETLAHSLVGRDAA